MSNKIWKSMWKHNDIGFHQPVISPLLQQFLPQLKLSTDDKILVPLCGKSHDMDFLTDSGHHVIGIELSNIAIQAYFNARSIKPKREKKGRFIRWWHHNIEIWCGDIFDLTENDIGHIKTLYDCTSLTALPPEKRPRYVQHFHERLPRNSQILLITTEIADETQQNSYLSIDDEVQTLYEEHYHIELLHGQNSVKQDPQHPNGAHAALEEKVYLLRNKALA